MSKNLLEIADRLNKEHRQHNDDYPDDVYYAYITAGNAYHAICDIHEIDDYSARSLYEQYESHVNIFTRTMENLLNSAEKLKKELRS